MGFYGWDPEPQEERALYCSWCRVWVPDDDEHAAEHEEMDKDELREIDQQLSGRWEK